MCAYLKVLLSSLDFSIHLVLPLCSVLSPCHCVSIFASLFFLTVFVPASLSLSFSLSSRFPLIFIFIFVFAQLHFEQSAVVAEHARCVAVLVEIAPFLADACRADAELLEYLHLLPAV